MSKKSPDYKYRIFEEIGKGAFSNVYLAHQHKSIDFIDYNLGKNYYKKYVLKCVIAKQKYIDFVNCEVKYFKILNNECKHIIHCVDQFVIKNNSYLDTRCLVFEYFGHNLYTYTCEQFTLYGHHTCHFVNKLVTALIEGLQFLHGKNILHCDLKPENIVVNADYHLQNSPEIKIIDLGSAMFLQTAKEYSYIQTRYYRSPSCILSAQIKPKIDFWSAGCILYEVMTNIPLFNKKNEYEVLIKQLRFIHIPHEEVTKNHRNERIYNYHTKQWRDAELNREKVDLLNYLKDVIKIKNIMFSRNEKSWLLDKERGVFSLIKLFILDYYSVTPDNYTYSNALNKVNDYYKIKFT